MKNQTSENSGLIVRLSSRLAKALCNGVRGGAISSAMLEEHAAAIHELEEAAFNVPSTDANADSLIELSRVWQEWKQAGQPNPEASEEALRKFAQLQLLTPPL